LVQPPPGRRAEGANLGRFVVEQIHHDDWTAALCGPVQGRVISDPQVIAEPDNSG
jgi:hypothetical protein